MASPGHRRRVVGSRPGTYPSGSARPKEELRPDRLSTAPSSPEGSVIRLSPATFIELTSDQERQAIEVLAELLVPLLNAKRSGAAQLSDRVVRNGVAPVGDT